MVPTVQPQRPGSITLFGSGETTPSGRRIFNTLLQVLPPEPVIALLETPAGFELNSHQVVERIAATIGYRLQNYNPQTIIVPARKRGTPFDPDDPELAAPILSADMVFMGPGSPTYAVRQLKGSTTWYYTVARNRLGGMLALSSAAVIAISAYALPVYEIYKVGEDVHWKPGLDFFAPYGLSLTFVPHWNNNDGGDDLDTSRCFMGIARFTELLDLLPKDQTMIGIDENTALLINCEALKCDVLGKGGITLIRDDEENRIEAGDSFALNELGDCRVPESAAGLPGDIWRLALESHQTRATEMGVDHPPKEVIALVEERQIARSDNCWKTADQLRDQIAALGWEVRDTPDGPELSKH